MNRLNDGPRSFRALWASSTASNLGDGLLVSAVPLLAAATTRNPTSVAAVTACATAPWLLFGLPAGAVVDRVDRVRLMRRVDVARCGVVALLALAVAAGDHRLPALYLAVFALGCAETLYDSAAMSVLPAVVDSVDLERANGRLFAGQIVANQFVGPPLGAFLFAWAEHAPVWIDAGTFLVSAVLLVGVRAAPPAAGPPSPGPRPSDEPRRASLAAEVFEGLRWIWFQRDVRLLAGGAAAINVAETAGMSVAVLYATGRLGMSSSAFGWVFSGAAAGAMVGTLGADRAVRALGRRRAVIASVAVFSAGLLVAGMVPRAAALVVGIAATSAAAQVWNVVAVAFRQRATPPQLLGRVMSAYRFIAYGAFPLGALAGGAIASAASAGATFVAGGATVAGLAVALAVWLGPLSDHVDQPLRAPGVDP